MTRRELFGDREFNKKLFRLTLPIALQSLMLAAVAAADAIMLGNVEQNMMSAVSLATQIQFIQNMILSALVSGTSILGAQYWGKHDTRTLNDLFCMSLRYSMLVCVLFFAGCVFFPATLMRLFTNEQELIDIGCQYLRIAGWSYLLTGISQCYLAIMKVSENAKTAATISSCTVIINIVLNAVLIYGLLGFKKMDVRGAATATLVARAIEVAWSILASHRKNFLRPDIRGFFRWSALLEKDFFRCTLPLLGGALVWGVGFTLYSAFMGHLGTDAAAGNSVASVVRDLVCCLCNGISAGGGIMVGNELGAGKLEKGKLYGDRLMIFSFICGVVSTLLMLAVTPPLLAFVKLTDGAQKLLLGMMLIMAVYMIGRAVNTIVINGVFSAGGDTLFDMYSLAVTMWGIAIPLAALGTFVFHWSPLVVYACTCLDEVGKIPWVMIHYRKYKWVKDLTRDEITERSE